MSDVVRPKRRHSILKSAAPKAAETNGSAGKSKSRKPSRPLPTDRIPFERHFDLLRAFAIASGDEHRAVRNGDVAKVAAYSETTLSQANAFFVDIGFLLRTPEGFMPSDEVRAFARAYNWNPSTAATKLAPVLVRSWVGEALLPRLQFKDISEPDAIAVLSEEVDVGPEYREQLTLLIEYMKECELIAVDAGGMLGILHASLDAAPQPERVVSPEVATASAAEVRQQKLSPQSNSIPSNVFNLSVDIHVPMEELNKWPADRISAFFAGIAAVLAAKNGGQSNTVNGE